MNDKIFLRAFDYKFYSSVEKTALNKKNIETWCYNIS